MSDINDIRKEIDGLHAKLREAELALLQCAENDPKIDGLAREVAGRRNTLHRRAESAWPTISAALAEAEEMRRKAERLQQIDEAFAQRSLSIAGTVASGKWIVHNHKVGTFASNDDLLTAIEAALAAKESK